MEERTDSVLREPLLNVPDVVQHSEDQSQHGFEGNAHEVTQRIPTPLPKKQLSVVLYLQLVEPIATSIIRPFIVKLINETGITGGDYTTVGYYAGVVEFFYFVMEALTVLQWGRISDRIGRRPVILIGLSGLGISMLLLGLSHSFWTVVASRAIAGALDANTVILRCVLGEITDETNVAQSIAFLAVVWSIGNTIGPLLGGLLQHPYERFGGVFEYSFWKTNPYFLPCFASLSFSLSAFLFVYCVLKETAPLVVHRGFLGASGTYGIDRIVACDTAPTVPLMETDLLISQPKISTTPFRSLFTQRVIAVILNFTLIALVEMAFAAIQPLFLSVPIENGGLGMPTPMIGIYMSACGISKGIVSVTIFPHLERRFGSRNVVTTCVFSFIGCFVLYPIMNALAKTEGGVGSSVRFMLFVQLALSTLPPMAFNCVYIYIMTAAPSPSDLGVTTGLAQTIMTIVRAISYASASSLFSLSMELNLLGGNLVYIVFCGFTVCAMAASLMLPPRPWRRVED